MIKKSIFLSCCFCVSLQSIPTIARHLMQIKPRVNQLVNRGLRNNSILQEYEFHIRNHREYTNKLLLTGAQQGNINLIIHALDLGADLETEDDLGNTPLLIASKAGNLEVVKYLLSLDANIAASNFEGKTASEYALFNKQIFDLLTNYKH